MDKKIARLAALVMCDLKKSTLSVEKAALVTALELAGYLKPSSNGFVGGVTAKATGYIPKVK